MYVHFHIEILTGLCRAGMPCLHVCQVVTHVCKMQNRLNSSQSICKYTHIHAHVNIHTRMHQRRSRTDPHRYAQRPRRPLTLTQAHVRAHVTCMHKRRSRTDTHRHALRPRRRLRSRHAQEAALLARKFRQHSRQVCDGTTGFLQFLREASMLCIT